MKYKSSKFYVLCLYVLGLAVSPAFGLTGEDIIKKVDANMTFTTARFESKMIIHVGDEVRIKKLVSYASGRDKSFAEFLAPPRDKGVKYLKIEDNMWMYLPSVEKIIKIEGHMLRQSMMGSDFSYEDALESSKLLEKYTAQVVTKEGLEISYMRGEKRVTAIRPCYVIDLVAKVMNVTYYKRRLWVDMNYMIGLKQELYAKSGKKLKEMTVGDIRSFGRRNYPMYYTMKDLLRRDSLTEMFITKTQFDIPLPAETFSQRNLSK